ncbi:MAG: metal-binding protein [Bradymonadales bacterium]|nr:MAG: metal-binding protein [Bradymonadales bacterium]
MNWFQLVSSARPIRSAKKAYFHENGRQVFVFHPQYFKKEFKLINSSGEIYLSPLPGAFGGHRGLKIYGRLDCRSALSWIRRGYYTEHRVFAATRIEFLKAGYRACKKCKP